MTAIEDTSYARGQHTTHFVDSIKDTRGQHVRLHGPWGALVSLLLPAAHSEDRVLADKVVNNPFIEVELYFVLHNSPTCGTSGQRTVRVQCCTSGRHKEAFCTAQASARLQTDPAAWQT